MATNNENHDKTYAIVRDAKAGSITVEDAVAKLKGLQDATELTEESYTMADNVVSKEETKEEKQARETQEKAIQSELSYEGTVDPGKDADADINNIVGGTASGLSAGARNETDDTVTQGVVPDDQLVSKHSKLKDNVLTTTEDGAKAKPTSESNEVAPAVGDEAREQNTEEKVLTRSQKKALRREAEAKNESND